MLFALEQTTSIRDIKSDLLWNCEQFAREVDRRARILRHLKVGRGSLIAILHGGNAHFFADLMAVWACGATAASLDESLTAPEIDNVVAFARPVACLVRDGLNASPQNTIVIDLARPHPGATDLSGVAYELDDAALVLFTSGTTGRPKAVVLSFRALLARLSLNVQVIGKRILRRTLVTLPTHFGHGLIGNALTPLFAGGEIFLPARGLSLAQELGRLIDEHEISFLSSVPSFWHMALRSPRRPSRGTLKRVHVGSAPLSATLWRSIAVWADCEVWNCYGITETANWIAGASSQGGIADGKIGRAWGGQIAVQREDGSVSSSGSGEIVVRTPSAMSGYLNRQDLTAQVLVNGWYRTGDVGRIDDQGAAFLSGRIKDEINRAGLKIQPADIDMLLESHPAVAEACSFAIADSTSGEIVGVAIRLRNGASATAEALRAWCGERIRAFAVPDKWYFVDEIRRTPRGKINRTAVRESVMAKAGIPSRSDRLETEVGTSGDAKLALDP